MTMKSTILCAITAILTAALFFCWGMGYAITHMTIEADPHANTALITLNDNVYIHDLDLNP